MMPISYVDLHVDQTKFLDLSFEVNLMSDNSVIQFHV